MPRRGTPLSPSAPAQVMGFHHAAREVWLVDTLNHISGAVEERVLVCDGSGEDGACHAGACVLGLCTSLADHLSYLGSPMHRNLTAC